MNGEPIVLDNVGPVIINTDGSLSRISNWHEMCAVEQERALTMIAARNKRRRHALEQHLQQLQLQQ